MTTRDTRFDFFDTEDLGVDFNEEGLRSTERRRRVSQSEEPNDQTIIIDALTNVMADTRDDSLAHFNDID